MSELLTVAHFLSAWGTRIMGSGSLRELLVLEKIGYGGVYVTDPVVPTFCRPKLTPWVGEDDDDDEDRRRGPTML